MENITWKKTEEEYENAYMETDEFFESLYELDNIEIPINNQKNKQTGTKISYREPQQRYASSVMEAIKENKILLIQAGVGTGKSFGYLIPIFYSWNNVTNFDKVIISTSTIALQDQLIQDLKKVSDLLGITIKFAQAKGINNYACLIRLYKKIENIKMFNNKAKIKILKKIKEQILNLNTADKNLLDKLDDKLWQDIRVNGKCEDCIYIDNCPFIINNTRIQNASIVVTNHTNLCNLINSCDSTINGASLIVIDEAHNLEEQMRLANQVEIDFNKLMLYFYDTIVLLKNEFPDEYDYEIETLEKLYKELIPLINEVSKNLKTSAKYLFRKEGKNKHCSLLDCDKLNIRLENKKINESIVKALNKILEFNKEFQEFKKVKKLDKYRKKILDIITIFRDLSLNKESTNIYWVKFIDAKNIKLCFTVKNIIKQFDKIVGEDKPIIFTSATMATNGKYDHFKNSLGLNRKERVEYENPIASPFNYDENSIFYYDRTAPNPNDISKDEYIKEITLRIVELIKITNGKALILFTNKTDMNMVYALLKKLNLKEEIIVQKDNDINECKEKFIANENSCLLATGNFWEGIDLPGKILSNLIVVKLPFPVRDPIVEYKKSKLSKQEAHKLELNEMLLKLAQGTGRLIRHSNDTGIVCCLDPRIENFLKEVKRSVPFKKFTTNINDIIKFSNENILASNNRSKQKNDLK